MTSLLDLLNEGHDCRRHALLPDMSVACGLPLPDTFGWCSASRGSEGVARGHLHMTSDRWHEVTCPWCHSLGRAWFHETSRRLQDRQAAAA